jgi:hypothetical protein
MAPGEEMQQNGDSGVNNVTTIIFLSGIVASTASDS